MKKLDFIENQKSISTLSSIKTKRTFNINNIIQKKKLNAKLNSLKTHLRLCRKKNENKKIIYNFEKIKELTKKSVMYKSCLILDKIKNTNLNNEKREEILRKNLCKKKMEDEINRLLYKLDKFKGKNKFLSFN